MSLLLLKKTINNKLIDIQKKLKTSYVLGYPNKLVIDTVDTCNLRCVFCPTGQRKSYRPSAVMSYQNFKEIIDKLGQYLMIVDLNNWGEPLLNSDIYKMIAYTNRYSINSVMSTNFNLFKPQDAEEMIWSGLDLLIIALDGTTQETYSKYRVGGDFNKVLENIKILVKKKKERNSQKPVIQWQFLVFKHNEHEIPDVFRMAEELGVDEVSLRAPYIYQDHALWASSKNEHSLYNFSQESHGKIQVTYQNNVVCDSPWTMIAIDAAGNVFPCCGEIEPGGNFGNINTMEIDAIWNGEKYRLAREFIKKKKVSNTKLCCYNCLNVEQKLQELNI